MKLTKDQIEGVLSWLKEHDALKDVDYTEPLFRKQFSIGDQLGLWDKAPKDREKKHVSRPKVEYDYIINFDGSCGPRNPGGKMGFSCTIKSYLDAYDYEEHLDVVSPHPGNTNNVAEYMGLVMAMEKVVSNPKYHGRNIIVIGDSSLVINQMSGRWRIKDGAYKKTSLMAMELLRKIKNLGCRMDFKWVPRDQNSRADELSKVLR